MNPVCENDVWYAAQNQSYQCQDQVTDCKQKMFFVVDDPNQQLVFRSTLFSIQANLSGLVVILCEGFTLLFKNIFTIASSQYLTKICCYIVLFTIRSHHSPLLSISTKYMTLFVHAELSALFTGNVCSIGDSYSPSMESLVDDGNADDEYEDDPELNIKGHDSESWSETIDKKVLRGMKEKTIKRQDNIWGM